MMIRRMRTASVVTRRTRTRLRRVAVGDDATTRMLALSVEFRRDLRARIGRWLLAGCIGMALLPAAVCVLDMYLSHTIIYWRGRAYIAS